MPQTRRCLLVPKLVINHVHAKTDETKPLKFSRWSTGLVSVSFLKAPFAEYPGRKSMISSTSLCAASRAELVRGVYVWTVGGCRLMITSAWFSQKPRRGYLVYGLPYTRTLLVFLLALVWQTERSPTNQENISSKHLPFVTSVSCWRK